MLSTRACLVSFLGGKKLAIFQSVVFVAVCIVQCEGEGEECLDKEDISFHQTGTRTSHMLLNYSAESGEDADDEAGRWEDMSVQCTLRESLKCYQ